MYYVYLLECADGSLYTGLTTDIARRLDEHNGVREGGAKYTRMRRPVALKYVEEYPSRSHAAQREHQIKQMGRPLKLRLITEAIAERK